MSFRVMIIDGHAEFRSLLTHHVTTYWPDAVISDYDPVESGPLPEEFSGAGNDIILLGSEQGNDQSDRSALETLRLYLRVSGMPPIIFFSNAPDDLTQAQKLGARGLMPRNDLQHDGLIATLIELRQDPELISSTDSFFSGDIHAGRRPHIRGYRIIEDLAVSEHSAVYLAENMSDGVQLVLKVLLQNPEISDGIAAFDRFLHEYELIAGLDHPNVVRIFDLGVSDNHAHITMEFLGGGNLKKRIQDGITAENAVRYTKEIASALARINSAGILHRDLKPSNIMLREDGSIALIDFGLAKRMHPNQEVTDRGRIFGTPYYMSPEQGHADEVDARSDLYSLGVILYEMLTGGKPFHDDNAMGIIYKHANDPVPILPHRHARYQAALNLMLAKKPEDRMQSADEVAEWL